MGEEFGTIPQIQIREYSPVKAYAFAVAMVAAVTTTAKVLQPAFDLINISLLFLLPVLISAFVWGLGPSMASSVLRILSFDYFLSFPFSALLLPTYATSSISQFF